MADQSVNRVTDAIEAGGNEVAPDLMNRLGAATKQLEEATEVFKTDKNEIAAKARDEAAVELTKIQAQVNEQNAKADAERDAAIDQMLADARNTREPSKAWMFQGGGSNPTSYQAGDFAYNLWARKSSDLTLSQRAKAEEALSEMGAVWGDPQGISIGGAEAQGGYFQPAKAKEFYAKATLGLTAATGGVLIPGAVVGDIVKPPRALTAAEQLVTTRRVDAYQSSMPVRAATPTRAAVVAWGDTKTNTNLTYGGYTATAYTLAIIYDIAKQFLRYSRGAAEADVREELETAFRLGRSYYILQGSGSSEPYGIQTAIGNAFGAYTSSFTASATTLAGSIATAVATAAGGLAVRNWAPEAALLGAAAYWTMVSQGTDTAGFFFAPAGGPTAIRPGTLVTPFGIPVYAETQLAGTDDLLLGAFSAVELYRSSDYRVDTSDEAGDRWDKNLVGFRGEEEIGLDARAAVFAGAFQFIADINP
jgi:HK97 family phage major capsid protein